MSDHEVTIEGEVVRKRYRRTSRDEPWQEWAALVLLNEHAPGLAPRPLALETDPPVVVMSRVDSARSQFDVDPSLGNRHWTRRTVQKMAASARDSMRSVERETLDALVGKPLLVANLMTHNSPLSMATRLVPVHDGEPVIGRQTSRRPSTALVHEALAVGYESLALIAWLVRDEDETTVVDDLVERGRYEFVVLRPDEHPGRNDPCPCGSSKKFKQCHGAPGKREAIAPQEGRGWRP